jgi:hypothetical protein
MLELVISSGHRTNVVYKARTHKRIQDFAALFRRYIQNNWQKFAIEFATKN